MKKIKEFFRNDHIQAALVTGFCIILLAVAFKKYLHLEISNLESAVPGLVFTGYELVRAKKVKGFWGKPRGWYLLMILATVLIILRHVL